ncbi:MAG: c-type cytochrome [Cyclobacteriaceae bacterium]
MKKLLLLIALFGLFTGAMTSCGGKQEKAEGDEEYGEYETAEQGQGGQQAETSPEEMIKQGLSLTDASDCKTCHHPTNKLIGPAHAEVAKKYEFTQANVDYLADKIVNGGSGVWGEIPMTPHVDLSPEDAKKMAMYVLSLDGEKPNL